MQVTWIKPPPVSRCRCALLAGSVVALLGAVIIAAGSGGERRIELAGVLVCLLAGVLYAAGMIAQKPVVRSTPALQAAWLGCTVGVLACLPFGPTLWAETAQASTGSILGLVYLGVFPTAIAFTTWAYALSRTPAGQLGATTYLAPWWPRACPGSCWTRYRRPCPSWVGRCVWPV